MENKRDLKSISALGAFALSVGTAIGWGSFVVTGSSFISKAGPMGSIIAFVVGMLIMLVMAFNYHYMMNKFPGNNGGLYTFVKHTLGGDHAFLASWFLIITYAAILWANVSSISLFARYVFGSTFQFGFHYKIGDYDVWLGEILLSTFFLLLIGGLCFFNKKVTSRIQIGFVLIFLSIILAGFIITAIMHKGGIESYKPDFSPAGNNEFFQIVGAIGMTPWAFIGFESISHSSQHFKFAQKKTFKVFVAAIVVTTIFYILMCQLCISVFPDQYANWHEYLTSSESLSGLDAVPAFYVIHRYIGEAGVIMFAIALLAIIATSIIGNLFGLTGLCSSMVDDGLLPKFLGKKDKNGNSIYLIIVEGIFAIIMLFLGRVLIGWIVDINNLCGIIIYAYISLVCLYQGKKDKGKAPMISGIAGLSICGLFTLGFIITSIVSVGWMGKESVAIFLLWAVFGFGYYAFLLKKDKKKMFGHSMIAVFILYALIIYSIGTWLAKMVKEYNDTNITVAGIIACVFIAIGTQVVFFIVFGIIRKREVDMQEKLVFGMATMVEGRDKLTGGHIRRTSKIVQFIAEEMIKDHSLVIHHRFYANVIKAAPMHDLGKISVDDAILRKPGKFTPEEFEEMKHHSSEGARIVEDILSDGADEYFEQIAINVAHYHHERWDGRGYPEGLKGEEIPLEARIMAIADVYDALVSKRSYKEKFTFEEANRIILEGMGTQFDPGLEKYYSAAREKIELSYTES